MTQTTIAMVEAVPLAHAFVAAIASRNGVRCLFIKGPGSVVQGLRPRGRTSSDVDVWVNASDTERLIALLSRSGWTERPKSALDTFYPVHSRTLYHPQWPCDIDVHSQFPGMDAESASGDVFETLWKRRSRIQIAHVDLDLPSPEDHALVLVLHALRTPWNPRGDREMSDILAQDRIPLDWQALFDAALETGATAAARPFLERMPEVPSGTVWPAPSDEWLVRTTARSPGSLRLIHLLAQPWHRRPALMMQALFPKPETLISRNLHLDVSDSGVARTARTTRLQQGLRAIPSALGDARRYRAARHSKSGD